MKLSDEEWSKVLESLDSLYGDDTPEAMMPSREDLKAALDRAKEAKVFTGDYDDEDVDDILAAITNSALTNVDKAGDKAAAATMGMTGKAAAAMNGEAYFPEAQQMANEDQTEVKVTEEDKDSDGDTDKTTVEKQTTEDDDDDLEGFEDFAEFLKKDKGTEESDNSSETEDKPHEEPKPKFENRTNHLFKHAAEQRFGY